MTDPTTVIPAQAGTQPSKPLRDLTDAELAAKRAKYHQKYLDAPAWDHDTIALALEIRDACDREIDRRVDGYAHAACHDCDRPYGDAHGFPDLIVPFDVWTRISPTGDDGGLLCPSCICKRLHDAGITCAGAFLSGPVRSVSPDLMTALRGIENIELALDGRRNRWGEALADRVREAIGIQEPPPTETPQ
jgi:hypothetical protein